MVFRPCCRACCHEWTFLVMNWILSSPFWRVPASCRRHDCCALILSVKLVGTCAVSSRLLAVNNTTQHACLVGDACFMDISPSQRISENSQNCLE